MTSLAMKPENCEKTKNVEEKIKRVALEFLAFTQVL